MQKPNNWDDINISAVINPGGHRCVIKKVEETRSSKGSAMLIINFDTDQTDSQPRFYSDRYLADQKAGKTGDDLKWKGKSYLVTDGEYGPSNLKRFVTAVEDSNPGFNVTWGDQFAACLIDKKVGVVFRVEEYTTDLHELRASVKPFRFCDYAQAADQPIPKRKEAPALEPSLYDRYKEAQAAQPQQMSWDQPPIVQSAQQAQSEGFMTVPDGLEDSGFPFH